MKPQPVGWDPVPGYEEPAKKKEVSEDGDHYGVAEHHMRHDPREERDEGAPRPEGGEDSEEEE